MMRLRLSLDYVFGGKGEPFLPPAEGPLVTEFTINFLRLPEEVQELFGTFINALANYERKRKIIGHKLKLDDHA